jgi:hypothetical protein
MLAPVHMAGSASMQSTSLFRGGTCVIEAGTSEQQNIIGFLIVTALTKQPPTQVCVLVVWVLCVCLVCVCVFVCVCVLCECWFVVFMCVCLFAWRCVCARTRVVGIHLK